MEKPVKLKSHDSLELARSFREASKLLGDFLYENWETLTPEDRNTLRSLEVTLLNVATDLVTQAVGVILERGEAILEALSDATAVAQEALRTIELAKKAISIATALIGLAAAIPTGKIDGIHSAIVAVVEASKKPLAHPRKATTTTQSRQGRKKGLKEAIGRDSR